MKDQLCPITPRSFPLLHRLSLMSVGNAVGQGRFHPSWGGGGGLGEDAISTDYVQICHRHKSTAVGGFTFLHVTSNAFLSVSPCFTASVQLLTAAEEGHPSPELLQRDVTFHVMLPECLLGANWKPSGPPVKVLFEPCVLSSSWLSLLLFLVFISFLLISSPPFFHVQQLEDLWECLCVCVCLWSPPTSCLLFLMLTAWESPRSQAEPLTQSPHPFSDLS